MPSKKKKYNARFPPARIKKIMQTNEDVGKVAAPVPVIISRALELFVESLIKKASDITRGRNAKTLTTSHLKLCILADGNFHFLKDLVAEIPDVQGDEDLSTSVICENQTLPLVAHQSRSRRQRDRTSGDSAGPSQSTADESETWSAEDDGEGDSENSSSETTSDHQVVSSVPPAAFPATYNHAFSSSASHCYLQQKIPHMQNCTAASSAEDDDYDS